MSDTLPTKTRTTTRMTDEEVMAELLSESALNKARAKFYHHAAKIEQALEQRRAPGPIEMRRMEFEATKDIIATFVANEVPQ